MPRLAIILFGPLRITLDGRPLGGLHSDKVRALLAYLALEPDRPHRRESLAGLLWPEHAERSARHSLSQALLLLHKALDQGDPTAEDGLRLITGQQTVSLSGTAGRVDAGELQALLGACHNHAHARLDRCPACHERLQRVAGLYVGELLAGFSLADSPAFEEWLLMQRERCHRLAVETLRTLCSADGPGDDEQRAGYARRWMELEPLDDEAQRALMLLLAQGGHRSAALAAFEHFRRLLQAEMGVSPEPATTELYRQIQAGSLARRSSEHIPRPATPPVFITGPERYMAPLFVARERELAQLQTHLAETLAGQPRVAFVTGEPGSGKTALLREFRLRALAADPDLVTAVGHCNAHTGVGDPYLAFRELLAQLSGDVEARWAAGAISGEQARRLWGLVPEAGEALAEVGPDLIGTLLPGEPLLSRAAAWASLGLPWYDALERQVRERGTQSAEQLQTAALFSQFTAVLKRLARNHPLLLVLEDLQWADAGTVALLFHLGCQLEGSRILILGAYRPTEVLAERATLFAADGAGKGSPADDRRHPLVSVVHEFARRYGDIEVDLNRADGRAFVDALLDSEPNGLGAGFRATLLRQCGGNALFTVEILRALQERGRLIRDERGWWVQASVWDWGRLPARVEGVIAERVGRLPVALQEALRVGSVEGETFTAEVVARVLGVEPLALVRELGGASGSRHNLIAPAGLGRAQGGSISSYRFRHILIQQSLYDGLEPAARVYLHQTVGDALVALHGGDEDGKAVERRHDHALAGELARHYEEAGNVQRAVSWLRRAGDRAEHLGAFAEAGLHHGRGLALTERLPSGPERDAARLPLLLGLAEAMCTTLGVTAPGVIPLAEEALAIAERIGRAVACVRALQILSGVYTEAADYGKAVLAEERMVFWARRSEDLGLIAWALCECADMHIYMGNGAQALQLLEPMLAQWDAGERVGFHGAPVYLPNNTVRLLTRAALALVPAGYSDHAVARVREAHAEARAENLEVGLYSIAAIATLVYLQLRQYEQALEWALEFGERGTRAGNASYNPWATACEGAARAHLGEGEKGIALAHEGLATTEAAGLENLVPGLLQLLADSCLAGGQAREALAAAERGLVLCAELGHGQSLAPLHLLRGEALILVDPPDPSSAEAAFQEALVVARRQSARLFELRAAIAMGRLWLRQSRASDARALVQPVYDWFTEGFDTPDLVEARTFLEQLAA